jgi:hypothetical protein
MKRYNKASCVRLKVTHPDGRVQIDTLTYDNVMCLIDVVVGQVKGSKMTIENEFIIEIEEIV